MEAFFQKARPIRARAHPNSTSAKLAALHKAIPHNIRANIPVPNRIKGKLQNARHNDIKLPHAVKVTVF